ncbi:MAG: response regulator [Calditrichaeota bacterium]|nr:MAG: response regulator [Calditrichota bacterium]
MMDTDAMLQLDQTMVYIAEDDALSQRMLATFLKKEPFNFEIFSDGSSLLEAARQQTPDLFLLDVMMPQLDGFATCRLLKKDLHLAHIPVLFLTADATDNAKEQGFVEGGVDYITKPYKQRELIMRIRTHLRLKKAMDKLTEYNAWLEKQLREQ